MEGGCARPGFRDLHVCEECLYLMDMNSHRIHFMEAPDFRIEPRGPVSNAFLKTGIRDFRNACEYVRNLRYQRTSSRSDPLLVLEEKRGTCSGKHAILKKVAEENGFEGIELRIGIYGMTARNTPSIEGIIPEWIPFIPEAHAYLMSDNRRLDFTRVGGRPLKDEDILEEISMSADEIRSGKELFHKEFIRRWCESNHLAFDRIWEIRESCIRELSDA